MAISFFMRRSAIGDNAERGFTLLEVMVASVVALIAIAAVYSVYTVQQHEYRHQQTILAAQQNLRASLVMVEQEIRMAGFDPEDSGQFGITDIRRYHPVTTAVDPQGMPALFYTVDMNEDGRLDANETYGLRIRDDRKLGRTYLTLSIGGGGRQRLSENITAWGIAYAVDMDQNGRTDVSPGGNHFIWAVDSDNDNLLDARLDTNDDGKINPSDDANGDLKIDGADGGSIDPPLPLVRIKAVRVWILSTTRRTLRYPLDKRTLMVGDRIYPPTMDGLQRRVVETVIECRNL